MSRQENKGFTLIELLIVVAIIGILTGLVTTNLQDARERARDVQRKADLKEVQKALEMYKNDQKPQEYPGTDNLEEIVTGGYMKELPVDPVSVQVSTWPNYVYNRDDDQLQYTLVACLENASDIDKDEVNNETVCSGEGQYSYTLTEP